jgi:glycosyltransferase involved in cell wall biosynthesis
MKLSVVIPCLNAADTIATQLEAVANQKWSETWEVIVSDNGSTDNTLSIVKEFSDRIFNLRIVDASGRKGVAHAYNTGAKAAVGESLVFCDADDEVASGWLAAMEMPYQNIPLLPAVQK